MNKKPDVIFERPNLSKISTPPDWVCGINPNNRVTKANKDIALIEAGTPDKNLTS